MCQRNLCTGNYFFPEESLEAAVESYHKLYNDFIVLYGAPILDNSPWQVGAASMDPRLIASDPRRYMISCKHHECMLPCTCSHLRYPMTRSGKCR